MIDNLVFGAASIGNLYRKVSDATAVDVLTTAWDEGIREYDTAPHYGLGLSEDRLGRFLSEQDRSAFRVSTKVGRILEPNPDFSGGTDVANGFDVPDDLRRVFDPTPSGVMRSWEASRKRLGLKHIDTLFLHDPDVYDLERGLHEALPALVAMREEGLVDEVGVGVNDVDAAVRAVNEADIDIVMIAGRYTLLEQPAAKALLPLCEKRGVQVIAAAVFNSGLLAATNPAASHYNYGDVPPDLLARVEELRRVCAAFGVTLPAAAMHYPLRHAAVTKISFGTARASAVQGNVAAARTVIPNDLWTELETRGLIEGASPRSR